MLKIQFIAALVIAALDDSWQKLKGIKEALGTKQQVSDEMKSARLYVCERCPVYVPWMKTCGSALRKHRGLGIRPGCGCFMPIAASVHHFCWLVVEGREGGWPKELNG